jgi:hypothetical protein
MQESAVVPQSDPEAFGQAIDTFRVYCGVVLLEFAQYGRSLRDTIARNFVARGMSCTQNIFVVWKAGSEQDAWILHRSLLERLFLLHHLAETDSFSDFDDYSFLSMYEARQGWLSDVEMKNRTPVSLKERQKADKARYDQIKGKQSKWRRPKAEDVAKKMDLGFLYKFGYDYASTHVHAMASDGEADYVALTTPSRTPTTPDATVVRNSILVQSMLVQEALNVSCLRWRAIVYDFMDQIRRFLDTGDQRFQVTMYKIGCSWPALQLCEPSTPNEGNRGSEGDLSAVNG